MHDTNRQTRKEYRALLRKLLNDVEIDKIKKLCSAADSDEKSFWKVLKGQGSSSQISAFLDLLSICCKLITGKNLTLRMWADHFETLGKPSSNMDFDDNFLARVTANVLKIFNLCVEDPSGALCAPHNMMRLLVFAPAS